MELKGSVHLQKLFLLNVQGDFCTVWFFINCFSLKDSSRFMTLIAWPFSLFKQVMDLEAAKHGAVT